MGKDMKEKKETPASAKDKDKKPLAVKGGAVEKKGKKKSDDIDAIFNAAKKAQALAEESDEGPSGREEEGEEAEGEELDEGPVDEALMRELADRIKKGRKQEGGKKDKAAKGAVGSKDDLFGSGGPGGRKRTEEGYAIFKETELANKKTAGTTPQCPFDCDCCFI